MRQEINFWSYLTSFVLLFHYLCCHNKQLQINVLLHYIATYWYSTLYFFNEVDAYRSNQILIYLIVIHSVLRILALVSALAIARALACACRYSYKAKHKPKHFLEDPALIFFMYEELRQPTKHANKIIILIFSIMKATIIDTCSTIIYVEVVLRWGWLI